SVLGKLRQSTSRHGRVLQRHTAFEKSPDGSAQRETPAALAVPRSIVELSAHPFRANGTDLAPGNGDAGAPRISAVLTT
ncbi:MAG: hypothetical protein ACRD2I_14715, partial [Vicinamibacterales bacterium]